MTKRELRNLEAKKREWEEGRREWDIKWAKVRKELTKDWTSMINWLLFYKPKGKVDKVFHIIEVVTVWLIIQLAYLGLRWG